MMHNQLVREYPYDKPKYTHEEMMRILQVHAKSIIAFLEKEKPDAIVFSLVAGLGSFLLYNIAKKKGIKTLIIHPTSMKHKYIITEERQIHRSQCGFQTKTQTDISTTYGRSSKILKSFRPAQLYYLPQVLHHNPSIGPDNLAFCCRANS
jgi:hypothetical protein